MVGQFKMGWLQFAERRFSLVWGSDMLIKVDFLKMGQPVWRTPPQQSLKPICWQSCIWACMFFFMSAALCTSIPMRTNLSLLNKSILNLKSEVNVFCDKFRKRWDYKEATKFLAEETPYSLTPAHVIGVSPQQKTYHCRDIVSKTVKNYTAAFSLKNPDIPMFLQKNWNTKFVFAST